MADLVTSAEVTAAWPGFADLAAGQQTALITAASRLIEQWCNRTFEQATVTDTISGNNLPRVWLTRPPIASITSVTINGTALDNTGGDAWTYHPTTGELLRGNGQGDPYFAAWFPRGFRNVVVVYSGGFATIPADVKQAAIITVRYFADAAVNAGLMRREKIGDYEYELSAGVTGLPSNLPGTAALLLRPYILS